MYGVNRGISIERDLFLCALLLSASQERVWIYVRLRHEARDLGCFQPPHEPLLLSARQWHFYKNPNVNIFAKSDSFLLL